MWPDRVSNLGPLTYESGATDCATGPGPWIYYSLLQLNLSCYPSLQPHRRGRSMFQWNPGTFSFIRSNSTSFIFYLSYSLTLMSFV